MDRVVRVLAVIYRGTCHVAFNNVRTDNNKMSIESFLGGVVMLVQVAVGDLPLDARTVYKGAVLIDKAVIKTEEGTWGASAHEEGYLIIKDEIYKIGGLK